MFLSDGSTRSQTLKQREMVVWTPDGIGRFWRQNPLRRRPVQILSIYQPAVPSKSLEPVRSTNDWSEAKFGDQEGQKRC